MPVVRDVRETLVRSGDEKGGKRSAPPSILVARLGELMALVTTMVLDAATPVRDRSQASRSLEDRPVGFGSG